MSSAGRLEVGSEDASGRRTGLCSWDKPNRVAPALFRAIAGRWRNPRWLRVAALLGVVAVCAETRAGGSASADWWLTGALTMAAIGLILRVNAEISRSEQRLRDCQDQLDAAQQRISRLESEGNHLQQINLRLADLSETDELTGLKNRRRFHDSLANAYAVAQAEGRSLSLLMLDVDHFKSLNDRLGHRAGDEVLRTLATILRDHVRPYDLVARYGGEEFMILLPDTDAPTGSAIAERLRAAIADHSWPGGRVTASFGVATNQPAISQAGDLIEAADTALYCSKTAGRDRVTHAHLGQGLQARPHDRPEPVDSTLR